MTEPPDQLPPQSDRARQVARRLQALTWGDLIAQLYDATFPSHNHLKMYDLEAARRQLNAIERLDASSRRLEKVSCALLATSLILIVLTGVLVWITIGHPWF